MLIIQLYDFVVKEEVDIRGDITMYPGRHSYEQFLGVDEIVVSVS